MGLDSFWILPGETKENHPDHPDFDPELHLIGGMFSGNGQGSFRGKSYAELIEAATGISIYQEEIPNPVIKMMAECLENFKPELGELDKMLGFDGNASENLQHLDDLKRMFRTYADAGACLAGWW